MFGSHLSNQGTVESKFVEPCREDSPKEVFESVLPRLVQTLGRRDQPINLLDFGAGSAQLYPVAQAYGLNYHGVEIDPGAREIAFGEFGVSLSETVDDLASESFDIVIVSEVIEHLSHPVETFESIRRVIKRDGLLYVATPNAAGLKARLLRERWIDFNRETHIIFFTPSTLEGVLTRAKFQLVTRLKAPVYFSGHSLPRRILGQLLARSGLDGAIRMVFRVSRLDI